MALTGLEIYKLLPKTNCKECGMPTCLAFAMQLAQKKTELERCPHCSEEAKRLIGAAAAPPMRLIQFGKEDSPVRIGQETVMFRHEEKFHHPPVIAVTVSDSLDAQKLDERLSEIDSLKFHRVGTDIAVDTVAVTNDSGSADSFAAAAKAADQRGFNILLVTKNADCAAAAAGAVSSRAVICGVDNDNLREMTAVASEHSCPVTANAAGIEELAELTEKIKQAGVEDIILSLEENELREQLNGLTQARTLALKKAFRPLGYPGISFVTGRDTDRQVTDAAALICKYAAIVVVDTAQPWAVLPMLTTIMNIFTDPQKPVQVQSKIYEIGEPDENSPVMFTTNFSLTYYTVESDVEASRISSYILVVDTEGTSVLTAYSGDKLNEKTVAKAMQENKLDELVKHRKLIIPGYIAVLSGKLQEEAGWDIMVGPRESSMIPKYLQEVWN